MSHPETTVLEFHRRHAEAAERLREGAAQRDADALASALTLCTGRYFTDRGALLVFLTSHEKALHGRSLTQSEAARTRRITDVIWAIGQDSGMAVIQDAPPPPLVSCAWCQGAYPQGKGFGVFCSRDCMIEEGNAPGGIEIARRPS